MLRNHHFRRIYRTQFQDLPREFYAPALRESIAYDRSSGFFSLQALIDLMPGLIPFIKNGGSIRLVTSVYLSDENRKLIEEGLQLREDSVIQDLEEAVSAAIDEPESLNSLDLITNLLACGRITIKIAYMPDAIYHEKFGIYRDNEGDMLYFSGSSNETRNGISSNRESITVLTSWLDDIDEIKGEEAYFEELWQNKSPGVRVFEFPEACERQLIRAYRVSDTWEEAAQKLEDGSDKKKSLYGYQRKAVNEFLANNGRHLFAMATGTGKTFTAIKAIEALTRREGKCIVAVVVPQTDLQEQWRRAFEEEGLKCHLFGGLARRNPAEEMDDVVIDYYEDDSSAIMVAVNLTFFDKVASRLEELDDAKRLLVVDEVHSLSHFQIASLPTVEFRLGLSATPERFSEEETQAIISYFTDNSVEPFKYGLEEAIEAGFLSRYYYHPLLVTIDDDDLAEFSRYQKRIAVLMNEKQVDQQKLDEARLARSRVLKKAPIKLRRLEELAASKGYDFINSVVYCGLGRDPATDESIIDRTIGILSTVGGYTVSSFTSTTIDRVAVIREFENGYYDTLVAIRCFDQGVDVPRLDKIYIMASDASIRQTVQRRGRVLRKCNETGKRYASIYDMVLIPPLAQFGTPVAKSLLQIELTRAMEYGRIAENKEDVEAMVYQLMSENGIDELKSEAENEDAL